MRAKLAVAVLLLLTAAFCWGLGWIAWGFASAGDLVGWGFALALGILLVLIVWVTWREVLFGLAAARLGRLWTEPATSLPGDPDAGSRGESAARDAGVRDLPGREGTAGEGTPGGATVRDLPDHEGPADGEPSVDLPDHEGPADEESAVDLPAGEGAADEESSGDARGGEIAGPTQEEFARARAAITEGAEDSWQAWFRLGLAYDACRDRRHARAAIRRAIHLERSA